LQSTSLLAVVAGYSCLFAFSSVLAETDRLERHQRLVSRISQDVQSGSIQLPLPSGFGVKAVWLAQAEPQPPVERRSSDGTTWLISRTPAADPDQPSGVLEVRQNITTSIQRQQRVQLLLIAAAGASALLTSLLLRVVIWRGLLQPLRSLTQELASLSADSLGQHSLDPAGQSQELQPIVTAFNHLQQRLAEAWTRERSFVDGVAHELRTPITVISSHAQRLQASAAAPSGSVVALIAKEAERMASLISVMLDFARGDSGRLRLAIEPLDPEALLLDAYERLLVLDPSRLLLAPALDLDLDWAVIEADRDRLQQCLAALVENALRYSADAVDMALAVTDGWVSLHVRDRGPGIPEPERVDVVQRFARGSSSIGTRGSGIGLATVAMLMQAMKGELLIADRSGGGADMQLRFKLSHRRSAP